MIWRLILHYWAVHSCYCLLWMKSLYYELLKCDCWCLDKCIHTCMCQLIDQTVCMHSFILCANCHSYIYIYHEPGITSHLTYLSQSSWGWTCWKSHLFHLNSLCPHYQLLCVYVIISWHAFCVYIFIIKCFVWSFGCSNICLPSWISFQTCLCKHNG